MRILLVNNLFGDSARGGAERAVLAEALALRDAGHEVAVLRARGSSPKRDRQDGISVFGLRSGNIFPYAELGRHGAFARAVWHLIDLFDWRAAWKAGRIMGRFRPDVVHTHNLMGIGLLLPAVLRIKKIRHIHTLHDVQLLDPSGALPASVDDVSLRLPAKLYARVAGWLIGSPASVISPSFFLLKAHRKYRLFPKSSGEVIFNPVLAAGESPEAESGPSEERTAAFLFAGQLEETKGMRTLLSAWSEWPGRREATLLIAGDGHLKEEAERAAADGPVNIRYLGRLDGADLESAYRQAAFTVLPSEIAENAPTSVIEGYAQGTPALAARTGGLPEMVREGETGFLFDPGDPAALRAAFDQALDAWREGHWPAMSEAARREAEGRSPAAYLERVLPLLGGQRR